ncbi:hypothetical protein HG619_01055 [Pseudomonas syringae]|nr:hypothetical protein [Pseudomonas syringae]
MHVQLDVLAKCLRQRFPACADLALQALENVTSAKAQLNAPAVFSDLLALTRTLPRLGMSRLNASGPSG